VINYRPFRNTDPPLIARVWNASLSGERVVTIPARGVSMLEYFLLSKPYFNPAGLTLAFDDATPVGLVLSGFAGNATGTALDTQTGVISLLLVIPEYRRRGIGRELLQRGETWLRQQGAQRVFVGPRAPHNPFTFGLYGGADSPGILDSLGESADFFRRLEYREVRSCGVFQRPLDHLQLPADVRFQGLRQNSETILCPMRNFGWWRECVMGPFEAAEFRLQEREATEVLARGTVWEMETYRNGWSETCVGLLDLEVIASHRRRGIAKFLLAQILLYLRQQSITLVETHQDLNNEPGLSLLTAFGFAHVDTGRVWSKDRLASS
jgi:GNAT superfamily N-acetyltransferase